MNLFWLTPKNFKKLFSWFGPENHLFFTGR